MFDFRLTYIIIYMLGIFKLLSQQDAHFSQYMFSGIGFNPAFAGLNDADITLIHRSQWVGYSADNNIGKAPTTQFLGGSSPVSFLKGGLGGYLINDQLGLIKNFSSRFSYAYHIKLKNHKISLGLSAGMYSMSFDNKYRFNDPGDPNINTNNFQQTRPDFSTGVVLKSDRYYLGASINHLSKPEFTHNNATLSSLGLHYYLTGGYTLDLSDNLKLKPSVVFKSDNYISNFSIDLNSNLHLNNKYWLGISYRKQESIVGLFGISFLKNNTLKFGYAFDYVTKGVGAKSQTSHEILVSYTIPSSLSISKPIVRTPRYRYN